MSDTFHEKGWTRTISYADIREGRGYGYTKPETGFRCMIRCFDCGRENYAPFVPSGVCAWCGHDANDNQPAGTGEREES